LDQGDWSQTWEDGFFAGRIGQDNFSVIEGQNKIAFILFDSSQEVPPTKWKFVFIDEGLYRMEDEFGFCLLVNEFNNVMVGSIENFPNYCSKWEIQHTPDGYVIVLGRRGSDQNPEIERLIGYGLNVRKTTNTY
jgi:hypothetical protein